MFGYPVVGSKWNDATVVLVQEDAITFSTPDEGLQTLNYREFDSTYVHPAPKPSVESYGTIWVCTDCMLHHANGECGACYDEAYGHDEEPLSAIGNEFHLAMGMSRDEHYEDCNPEDDCYCETNTFSTSMCEGCTSFLHGERHAMTLFLNIAI